MLNSLHKYQPRIHIIRVGAPEGELVGDPVGALVGETLGEFVGLSDGESDHTKE